MLKYLFGLLLPKCKQKPKWRSNKHIEAGTLAFANLVLFLLTNFSHTLKTDLLIKLSQHSQLLDDLIGKLLDGSHYYGRYFGGWG
jgi:hypothetical protein